MYQFSIITPTYNRAQFLPSIYKCLKHQKSIDFEWIVVDDGSIDETKNIVKGFERLFEIKYHFQKNKGKPSAVNAGVEIANSLITIILDDDDILMPNILNVIWSFFDSDLKMFKNNCSALSGLCIDKKSNMIIASPFSKNCFVSNFFSLMYGKRNLGDKCHVFSTKVLKQYPWPIFLDESFITEALVFNRMAADGHTVFCLNSIFKIVEYLPNGLSSKYNKLMMDNPFGSELYYNEASAIKFNPYWHIRLSANYIKYAKINNRKNIFLNSKNKVIYLFGIVLYYLYFKIFNKLIGNHR